MLAPVRSQGAQTLRALSPNWRATHTASRSPLTPALPGGFKLTAGRWVRSGEVMRCRPGNIATINRG